MYFNEGHFLKTLWTLVKELLFFPTLEQRYIHKNHSTLAGHIRGKDHWGPNMLFPSSTIELYGYSGKSKILDNSGMVFLLIGKRKHCLFSPSSSIFCMFACLFVFWVDSLWYFTRTWMCAISHQQIPDIHNILCESVCQGNISVLPSAFILPYSHRTLHF